MKMKTKTFDCVEMKRRGAEKIRSATEDMTRQEELAFWEEGTEELLGQREALRKTALRHKGQ